MDILPGKPVRDLSRGAVKVPGDLHRGDQQHSVRGDELELFRVVVAAARDDNSRRLDA